MCVAASATLSSDLLCEPNSSHQSKARFCKRELLRTRTGCPGCQETQQMWRCPPSTQPYSDAWTPNVGKTEFSLRRKGRKFLREKCTNAAIALYQTQTNHSNNKNLRQVFSHPQLQFRSKVGCSSLRLACHSRSSGCMGKELACVAWIERKKKPHHKTRTRALLLHKSWACAYVIHGKHTRQKSQGNSQLKSISVVCCCSESWLWTPPISLYLSLFLSLPLSVPLSVPPPPHFLNSAHKYARVGLRLFPSFVDSCTNLWLLTQ